MSTVLALSLGASLLLMSIFGLGIYGLGEFVLRRSARHARQDPNTVPVAAFMGTVAMAWALALGFVAADVWALNGQADKAVSSERSAIQRLIGMVDGSVLDSQEFLEAVRLYRAAVIEKEWGEGGNLAAAGSVDAHLQRMRVIATRIAQDSKDLDVMIFHLVNNLNALQDARNLRIASANTIVDEYKWYLLLSLTVLTTVAIALTHADRVPAGRRALLLYALTASICLWILLIHANPFVGIDQIPASLLHGPALAS